MEKVDSTSVDLVFAEAGYEPVLEPVQGDYAGFQADLPDFSELPREEQRLIASIQGMETDDKRLQAVHRATIERIQYVSQPHEDISGEQTYDFRDVMAANFEGDCDDHATYSAAMLRYLGYDEEQIQLIEGQYTYELENGESVQVGHAALQVGLDDGRVAHIDKNLQDVSYVDGTITRGLVVDDHHVEAIRGMDVVSHWQPETVVPVMGEARDYWSGEAPNFDERQAYLQEAKAGLFAVEVSEIDAPDIDIGIEAPKIDISAPELSTP